MLSWTCIFLFSEEQVVFVKQEMQGRGFYSRDFSQLPNDMSGGSRELLLALAWLLCTEKVIDKFMENCASPIEEDSYTPDVKGVRHERTILLVSSADNLCKQIGPRSGQTKCRAWSGSNLFDARMVFLK